MFKATEEIIFNGTIIQEGDIVENPTQRMKDLGLVVEVTEAKAAKAAPAPAPEEEILTEVSANVSVEIQEDDPDVVKDVKTRIMEDGVVDEKEQRVLNKIVR